MATYTWDVLQRLCQHHSYLHHKMKNNPNMTEEELKRELKICKGVMGTCISELKIELDIEK